MFLVCLILLVSYKVLNFLRDLIFFSRFFVVVKMFDKEQLTPFTLATISLILSTLASDILFIAPNLLRVVIWTP